jgi:hypothetical protein
MKQENNSKNNLPVEKETNPGLLEYEAGTLTLQAEVIYIPHTETQQRAAILKKIYHLATS